MGRGGCCRQRAGGGGNAIGMGKILGDGEGEMAQEEEEEKEYGGEESSHFGVLM